MPSFWERFMGERVDDSALTSIQASYDVICDVLNISRRQEDTKRYLLAELYRIRKVMTSYGEQDVENAVTRLSLAVASLDDHITSESLEMFRIIAPIATEAFSVASTFPGKLLASQIEIICTFYSYEYFTGNCSIEKLAATCAVIFENLLDVPEVAEALAQEFERRKLSTRLWILVRRGADSFKDDTAVGRDIVDAIGALENILEEYTLQRYHIRDKNGELMHLNVAFLRGHTDAVLALVASKTRDMLFSGSADTTIKIWNVDTLAEVTTLEGHNAPVTVLCLSGSGDRLLSGSADGSLKLWDLDILTEVASSSLSAAAIISLAVNGDDAFVGFTNGMIAVVDHVTLRGRMSFQAHSVAVSALAVSSERRWLFSGGSIMKVWDIRNLLAPDENIEEVSKLRDHSHAITAITVSGNTLYSGSRSVKVWDLNSSTPEMIACLRKHMSNVKQIIVDENEGFVFSAGCSIKVWSKATWSLQQTIRAHSDAVFAIALVGDLIFSGSSEKNIHIRRL